MNRVLRMVEGLRDPFQAKYYQGDLHRDAADELEALHNSTDMEDLVEKVQEKLPEVSDFDNLVDELDAVGDEETVEGMMEKVMQISSKLQKMAEEQEEAIQILIDESEKANEN